MSALFFRLNGFWILLFESEPQKHSQKATLNAESSPTSALFFGSQFFWGFHGFLMFALKPEIKTT